MPRLLWSALLFLSLYATRAEAQLTWGLADGNETWPAWAREAVTSSMNEAVELYNRNGYFQKHITANYHPGVPTAEGNYDGWITFGGQYNTRVALHEIAHALGIGTYWGFNGGAWDASSAAGKLIKVYEGQGAVLNTGGSHFWPYGLNYDNEDGAAARERHARLVAAFRFDMGIVKDSDGDGLPDDWEMHHFGGLTQQASDDADGDGIDNGAEYASDSDPNLACPVKDGRTYTIRSQISARAATVAEASPSAGAPLVQRELDAAPWQQWTAHYVGEGYFRFTHVLSGKVLELPGTDTASGRPLQLADWTGALQQQWRIVKGPGAEDGHWQIANRETGRVMDGLDGADGAPIQQWPFLGNLPQQFWQFEEIVEQGAQDADAGTGQDGADSGTTQEDADGGTAHEGAPDAGAGEGTAGADTGGPNSGDASPEANRGGCSLASGGQSTGATPPILVALACLLIARLRGRRRSKSAT